MNIKHVPARAARGAGNSQALENVLQVALALTDLIQELSPTDRRVRTLFRRRLKQRLRDSAPKLDFYRQIIRTVLQGA